MRAHVLDRRPALLDVVHDEDEQRVLVLRLQTMKLIDKLSVIHIAGGVLQWGRCSLSAASEAEAASA